MSQKTNGLNYLNLLEIGTDELQWWQAEQLERLRFGRMAGMASPGWFGSQLVGVNGAGFAYGWEVQESGGGVLFLQTILGAGNPIGLGGKSGNQLTPQRFGGVLPDGSIVEIDYLDDVVLRDAAYAGITVPNDSTWYTLVATVVNEIQEPGRITLVQGSTTIQGVNGTKFTRYSDATDPIPTVIRVDAADSLNGNEGSYTVVAITDDDTMTVTPAPPGSGENVRYRVQGRFYTTPTGEQDAHRNVRVAWALRSRITTPPADALVAYDCYRSGGVLTLVDRRAANEYRPMPDPSSTKSTRLALHVGMVAGAGGSTDLFTDSYLTEPNLGSAAVLELDLAPCNVQRITGAGTDYNGMLLAVVQAAGIYMKRAQSAIASGLQAVAAIGWAYEALALKIAQINITGVSLITIPKGKGGWTHVVAYSVGGKVTVQRSADNGSTWVSLGVVWDPAIVNAAHTAHSPALLWTKWGRLILGAVYDTGGGSVTVRTVHSDDYGDTWTTSGNAGTTVLSATVAPRDLSLVQDGWGNIVGTYIEDAANDELWMWYGTGPNNAVIDPDKASTANRGTKMIDSSVIPIMGSTLGQPRAVAYHDGTIVVAVGAKNATPGQRVILLHAKQNEALRIEALVTPDGTGYAGPTLPVCAIGGSNTGDAWVAYSETKAAAAGDLYVTRLVSQEIDVRTAWPGGR